MKYDNSMRHSKEFIGEALGTFLLVLFGCGSVAVSILFNAYEGIMQIALAWGIGVTLAIYLTRHLSCAHLNPAVSLAMVISKRMSVRKLPVYLLAQFAGAFFFRISYLYLVLTVNLGFRNCTQHYSRYSGIGSNSQNVWRILCVLRKYSGGFITTYHWYGSFWHFSAANYDFLPN